MNKGLHILVEEAMVPFEAALNSCTINPARALRVDDRKGRLAAGYDADIVVIMLGTNDSKPANWVNEEDFIKKYDNFINSYKENHPDVKIILCTPAKC